MQKMRAKRCFFLFLSILSSTSSVIATCPSKCTCNENQINCVERGLQDVPIFETINTDPVIIDLSGNKLISIDIYDFSFERNTELKEVYLNKSEITDIEDRSFDELVNLQELYLHNNNLKSISKNIVKNNKNLIVLDLSNNIFETFPTITSSSLEVLALANSGISKIHEGDLKEIPKLRVLLLQENKIRHISPIVFDQLQNSFYVKLAYNLWNCNCDTVRLFDFLVAKGYTDVASNEPIQCITKDKNFQGIYYRNGSDPYFQKMCSENPKVIEENNHILKGYKEIKQVEHKTEDTTGSTVRPTTAEEIKSEKTQTNNMIIKRGKAKTQKDLNSTVSIKNTNFYMEDFDTSLKTTLLISIPISFLLGMLFGCYLTFTYGISYVKLNSTESSKELLSALTEGLSREEYA